MMLLKNLKSGHLIEVEDLTDLTNPFATEVVGRELWGEERQDPENMSKAELGFPSGEAIPESWTDPHYLGQAPTRYNHPGARDPGVPEAEQEGYQGA